MDAADAADVVDAFGSAVVCRGVAVAVTLIPSDIVTSMDPWLDTDGVAASEHTSKLSEILSFQCWFHKVQ